MTKNWDDPWGDRRQEIVFIGHGMNQSALTAALDSALVETPAFTPKSWANLHDPFPRWAQAAK